MNWVTGTCKGYINPSLKPLFLIKDFYIKKKGINKGVDKVLFPSDNPLINLTLHAKSPPLKGSSVIET